MTGRALAGVGLLLQVAAAAFGGAPPAAGPDPDPHYARVLSAYRGELTADERLELGETDPAVVLFVGPNTPAEWDLARWFASLPDARHQELRRSGWLKWRVRDLPGRSRALLLRRVEQLGLRGEGPFPLERDLPSASGAARVDETVTGFARVEVPGGEGRAYCWWIDHPKARRPGWLVLVRAVRLSNPAVVEAVDRVLAGAKDAPLSPALREGELVRLKEPQGLAGARKPGEAGEKPEPPKPLMDERRFWDLVRAYRGDLRADRQALLVRDDPLVAQRLASRDPADLALHRFFGRLPRREHEELLTTGRISWGPQDLSERQRRELAPLLERVNRQAREGGAAGDPFLLAPFAPVRTGFTLVRVPEVEQPALAWWIQSAGAVLPAWITLSNREAVRADGYVRALLEQIGEGR